MNAYKTAETLIRVSDIHKSYGPVNVLKGVSCEIKDIVGHGQIVGFLGPSGCGKTTLLNILAGLAQPDSGAVTVFDAKQNQEVPITRGVVGVVKQHYPLFDHRTIIKNLLVAAPKAEDKAKDLLQRFGLADKKDKYPCQLSGGQRQRVAIIQQLLCSEHYILMDEPFSGLDPLAKEQVCSLIKEVVSFDEKNTVIVVTHDINSAVSISNMLWLMGRDRDQAGSIIPGAYIKKVYDLAEMGLAWRGDVSQEQGYVNFVRQVHKDFDNL